VFIDLIPPICRKLAGAYALNSPYDPTFLRSFNLYNAATKEFLGANIPHVILVANRDEAMDQAINQFGNTGIVFGASFLYHKLIDRLNLSLNAKALTHQAIQVARDTSEGITKHAKTVAKQWVFKSPKAQLWYNLGKGLAIYTFLGSYVVASPFFRNWVTLKRTKSLNYTAMVGLTKKDLTEKEKSELKQKERFNLKEFAKIWGIGTGVSLAILGATQALIRRGAGVPKLFKFLEKHLGLPHGDFRHFKDLPMYLFWALPAYSGLLFASRDALERKEIYYRMAGFGLAFMVLPRTLERWINNAVKGKTFKVFGPGKNVAYLGHLLSGLIFYTSIPTIITESLRSP